MKRWLRVGALAAVILALASGVVFYVREQRERDETLRRAQVHLERGVTLYNRKAWQPAEDELRRALRMNRDDWSAPYYVGVVQIERKRYGLAIPYLELALSLNPKEPKILTALGVTYFKLGRLDMARGYFWAALAADPGNSDAKGLMESMAKLQWRQERAGIRSTGHAPAH